MKSTAILRIHATATLALVVTLTAATAQTWNGEGADNNWTTADNWGGTAPAPSTTTDLVFAGDTRTTPENDFEADSVFRSIIFDSAAGAFNLTGNPITLNGNISINNNPASPITQTISLGLQLTGNRSIAARGNGLIQIDGDISQDATNRTLQITSSRVALNGANTFTTLLGWGGTAVISSLADNGSPSAAGSGNMRLGNGVTAGNIEYTGGAVSTNKGIQLGAGTNSSHSATGWFRNNGSGKVTFTGTNFNPQTNTTRANRILELGGSADIEVQGVIRDNNPASGSTNYRIVLSKTGAGTLSLSGTNTYSGATTVTEGTLALSGSGSIANTPSITLAAGAVMDVSMVSFALGGEQSLGGNGSVDGDLSDAIDSKLIPGGVASVGTLTFNNKLSLNGGGILQLDMPSGGPGDMIVVAGDLEASGITTIQLDSFPAPGSTHTIIEVTGALGGSPANFVVSPAAGYSVEYDTSGPVNKINLVRQMVPPLTWQGDGTANLWDVGGTANWTNELAVPVTFQNGDGVVFGNTGSDTPAIDISGDVLPSGVLVNNTTRSYTFSGAGSITGGTSLSKDGSGTLTVLNTNTYTGGTTISGGTLQVGNGSATGSISGNIANDAILVFNPAAAATVAGDISGSGQLIKNGDNTLILTGGNSWSGGTVVNAGTLQIGANGTTGTITGDITNNAALVFNRSSALDYEGSISGSGSVTVAGGGAGATKFTGAHSYTTETICRGFLVLANPDGNCLAGNLLIEGVAGGSARQVRLGAPGQLPDTALVTLGGNAPCRFVLQGFNETIGGLVSSASSGNSIVESASDGSSDKPAVLTIDVAVGQTHSFSGSGAFTWMRDASGSSDSPLSVVKAGPGKQIIGGLDENISFSGGLWVTGGTLELVNCSAFNSIITNDASLIINIQGLQELLTRSNPINGTGTLTKQGAGSLILTDTNSYTGDTTVTEGTLSVAVPGFAATSTVSIGSSGLLELPNPGTRTVAALILNGNSQPDGIYGEDNSGGLITGAGKIRVGAGSDYDDWAALFGAEFTDTDPASDPDGDGLDNFTEYAFGLNPVSGASVNPITSALSGSQFSYTRRATTGLSYKVFTSTDLAGWTEDTTAIQVPGTPDENSVQSVTVTVTATPDNGRLFVRIAASE